MNAPVDRSAVLDHVIGLTPDLDATSALFERLGFKLTSKAPHSEALGTENRCVMLRRGYIELLAVSRATQANASLRARLAQGGGWAGVAFATSDVGQTQQLLQGHCELGQQLSFTRLLPDSADPASFTILPVMPRAFGGLQMFFCQHHTPALLWRLADLQHPNDAQALEACAVAATDVARARAFLERIGAISSKEIDLASEPARGSARISHVTVRVAHLSDVRARAERSGLMVQDAPGGVDLPMQVPLTFPLRFIGE